MRTVIIISAPLESVPGDDIAKGTSEFSHMHPLSEATCDKILPIFKVLSSQELLRCCLMGVHKIKMRHI